MRNILFRCHAIGKLMIEPKTIKEGPLSVGARTYIRTLAAQELFGVDFEIGSKVTEKGLAVEGESTALLNRVRGLSLVKNNERRSNDWITGEADIFDANRRCGHDIKSAWSVATFPISEEDFGTASDKALYDWQMAGYMMLWDCDKWEVNHCLVDTPPELLGQFDPIPLHVVGHIPESMRVTSRTVMRSASKEAAIIEKVRHARDYFFNVISDFDLEHRDICDLAPDVRAKIQSELIDDPFQ